MRTRIAIIVAVFIVLAGSVYGLYRYYYPLGMEHRCDILLWFALREYAEKHNGAFPSGEAMPEASISLVHSLDECGHEYAYLLHRRDVSTDVVQQMLQRGELLGPDTCGWNYVEGLRLDSNPKMALFWDKEGLGHNGERLPEGGHTVTFVSGLREYIPEARWDDFLAEQRRLLTEELRKSKSGAPGLGSDTRSIAMATEPAVAACSAFEDGRFSWKASGPLVAPDTRAADPAVSVKDPTIVRYRDRWHIFCTVRLTSGKVDVVYLSFADWKEANQTPRHLLNLHDQYYCAPQVFYFRPHERWYLIYQIADKDHQPPFGPAFSTSTELGNPTSWSKPRWLFPEGSERRKWLDFWVICDRAKAHLFYTSLDGRMWRAETKLADFPGGWSEPQVALTADIFEASHTYKLKGLEKYLTIVEAQGDGRRYYNAYLADGLEGPWKGLADSRGKPFAASSNVEQETEWTTNISHGELLRTGVDETIEIDPADVRLLFQGASDAEYRGNPYGKIPWRLGILEMRK